MTDANVSLQGAANSSGGARDLFYKVFTGEVLTAYDRKNVMEARHRIRNIRDQKSAGFANTGQASGRIHTPGQEISGQNMQHNETVISVDDLIISDVFVADLYDAMNHYEVRSDYSHQLGQALARTFDKQTMRVAAQAARSSNKITGLPGGTTITLSTAYNTATDADKAVEFADSLFAAHQTLVENDVVDGAVAGAEDAYCLIKPDVYFRLVRNKDLLNQDWGGLGSFAMADLPMVAGIPLVVTNNLPQQNDGTATTDADGNVLDGKDVISPAYSDDYSLLEGLVVCPNAIGTVKLIDVSVQSEWDIRRQGYLMVARMATGHGVLRPECSIEIVRQ